VVPKTKQLGAMAAFEGLDPAHLKILARLAVRRRFPAGTPIFTEGESAGGFYAVLEGRVRVYKLGADGREQILHICRAGEPFGEAAVFEGAPYPAHADSMDDVSTIFIPRDGLIDEVRRNPDFALALLTLLSRRLRRLAGLVESLSLREVPGRLAAYLLLCAERAAESRITLEVSKSQLAALLGTIPETLSRILGKLNREGMIATEGPRGIVILDRAALRRLADGEERLS